MRCLHGSQHHYHMPHRSSIHMPHSLTGVASHSSNESDLTCCQQRRRKLLSCNKFAYLSNAAYRDKPLRFATFAKHSKRQSMVRLVASQSDVLSDVLNTSKLVAQPASPKKFEINLKFELLSHCYSARTPCTDIRCGYDNL
jgi:hypothetical protein